MKRSWKDLGKVWSGRDLAVGEEVTLNVFDKSLSILLEQINFRPSAGRCGKLLWVQDFCLYINGHSALVRAGVENASGEWEILASGDGNHFRNLSSRELVVTTTVPSSQNWSSERRVLLQELQRMKTAGVPMTVTVRTAQGDLLETITFTLDRIGVDQWPQEVAKQINAVSRFVRAGSVNGESIQPVPGVNTNFVWLPHNGDFKVHWSIKQVSWDRRLEGERDARPGERLSTFLFDRPAQRLIERITIIAGVDGARLGQAQWPADLARKINASSQFLDAGVSSGKSLLKPQDCVSGNIVRYHWSLQHCLFPAVADHFGWGHSRDMVATTDLRPDQCVVVKVVTFGKGNICEALTFRPDPNRLKPEQWLHDLALYINAESALIRAGVKDEASKTFVAKEDTKANAVWVPTESFFAELRVKIGKVSLKEVGYISAERDLGPGESCKAFVIDDTTEEVLEEIDFTPADKRNGSCLAPKDLAVRINSQTQLIAAGEKKDNEAPLPIASGYRNVLWACDPNVRAFSTFMSPKNWVKGPALGSKDFQADQQMVIRVKGSKTGRIFESLVFRPHAGHLDLKSWTADLCYQVNGSSKFLRAGEANAKTFVIEASASREGNCFWTPAGSGLEVEAETLSGVMLIGYSGDEDIGAHVQSPGMISEDKKLFDQYAEARRLISIDARTGLPTLNIPVADLYADDSLSQSLKVSLFYDTEVFIKLGTTTPKLAEGMGQGEYLLVLRDGRTIKTSLLSEDDINGGDFIINQRVRQNLDETWKISELKARYKDGGAANVQADRQWKRASTP